MAFGAIRSSTLVAQPFPVAPSLPLATGAFIQLHAGFASKSAAWWQAELSAMKNVGMDTVVVNYVAYDNFYFYPTSVPGGSPFAVDAIENVLDAADGHGMDVFLGLHLDPDQFSTSTFDLPRNLAQGQAELSELWTRYGSHESMAGWYMPQEISDYMAFYQPQLRNSILSYTKSMTDQAHTASELPMMISPYFGQNPNAAAYANWWDTTGLPQTGVDIVAMQDGVGTHRTTIEQSRAVFQALEQVMRDHEVAFWANNESFNQIHGWPVDTQSWAATPTSIETFVAQIESTNPFVEKAITFEFSHYMSPQGTPATIALYQNYKDYFDSIANLPGDYDFDGILDAGDYEIWRAAFGSNNSAADGNLNDIVDAADYVIWRANLGMGPQSGTTSAPEPVASLLAFAGGLGFASFIRHRRKSRENGRFR
jgi:uncharacterized protein DUF4434